MPSATSQKNHGMFFGFPEENIESLLYFGCMHTISNNTIYKFIDQTPVRDSLDSLQSIKTVLICLLPTVNHYFGLKYEICKAERIPE
jgi:hypothetical protein